MSALVMDTARIMELLPETDQRFAYEFVRQLVFAWDTNFTKVTPEEAAQVKAAEQSGFVSEDEIDWNTIGQ